MAAVIVSSKANGPLVDPALCRCCRSIKKCRLLTAEYQWKGFKEVYSDMFMDCFGLLLSNLEGDSKEVCICATCVGRLRDATEFKKQVLQCEQVLMDAKFEIDANTKCAILLDVKCEPCDEDSDHSTQNISFHEPEHNQEKPDIKMDSELKPMNLRKRRKGTEIDKKARVKKEEKTRKVKKKAEQLVKHYAEKDDVPSAKNPKQTPTKDLELKGDDNLSYENALTIAYNSYVTPFMNRISIYYCYYCRDQFTDPAELRKHTLNHNPKKEFKTMMENKKIPKVDITRIDCRLCEEKINDIITLKRHLSEKHGKVFHNVSNEFLTFKLELDAVSCTECNATFPYFDTLKKHMIEHFGSLICDQCGACFLEESSLRTHIKTHSKVEVLYPCEVCGKNLKSKYSMFQHIATIHEKKPTVNCYKCEAMFLSHAQRNRHLIEVHGDKRTFPCKFCDKVYNRRKTLGEHNRRNHAKVFNHQCDFCDQKFYVPSRLKEHMATHTGERNFRCDLCDKCYPRLQSLQEHIRSHNNERKFKCSLCNSSFTQNGSLKTHMKSHHQGFELDSVKYFSSVSAE